MSDRAPSLDALQQLLANQPASPPLADWQPPLSGVMNLRIAADGQWWHDGRPILRPALVKLFAGILRREQDGQYYLVTPAEKWQVEVEDAALLITDLQVANAGQEDQLIVFSSNIGEHYPLSNEHPLRMQFSSDHEPRPYLALDHGLTGLIVRSVFYRLVDLATASAGELVLHSDGQRFSLGSYQS